jgi:sodium/proline symporter
MTREQLIVGLVVVYAAFVSVLALWAHRRTHHPNDYLIANRRAGVLIVALSQGVNLLPLWLMLVVVGSAFVWGAAAMWMGLALWLGGLAQACYVAPRARWLAASQHVFTLTQILSCESGERMRRNIVRSASFLIALTLIAMILIQLRLIGDIMAPTLATGGWSIALIAACLLIVGTAGWWACALMEATHAVLLLLIVLFTALVAFFAIGGLDQFFLGVQALDPQFARWDGGRKSIVAVAFIGGVLSMAGLPLGQPNLLNRALAARDELTLRWSAVVQLVWLALMLTGLLCVGWFARVLYFGIEQPELVLFEVSRRSLPPGISATISVIASAAILTNVISQLGVLSSVFVGDMRPGRPPANSEWSRAMVVLLVIFVLVLLQYADGLAFADLSFCWNALGASLAPVLLVRLGGKRVRAGSTIGAMSAGFLLVCVFHAMPDAPGDFLERVLPFVAGLGIALSGGERRRNPDRADRSEQTVHDRLPI